MSSSKRRGSTFKERWEQRKTNIKLAIRVWGPRSKLKRLRNIFSRHNIRGCFVVSWTLSWNYAWIRIGRRIIRWEYIRKK